MFILYSGVDPIMAVFVVVCLVLFCFVINTAYYIRSKLFVIVSEKQGDYTPHNQNASKSNRDLQ